MKLAEIQQRITHFSEQIHLNPKLGEEVVIGGKITSIVAPIGKEYPYYIAEIDDIVGVLYVFIPSKLYDEHANHFQMGEHVFLEGIVNVVSRTVRNQIKKEISIFAYNMKDISKVGDTKS